ncbi:MAG TPA: O-antigen ligase family protein, partial [Flavobacteriales bacterium]|nr:O-antigen ligase family protein [Flavobacteriales bacterium]
WGTAVRYLASKGLRKDSVAIMSLNDDEIHAIEQGRANALHDRGTIRERIEEVLMEIDLYRNGGSASGHSVTMRVEFQKAGLAIARSNMWCGVGTGDTQRAFNDHYAATHSTLDKRWWLRAHNEYLTLWISFGILGLLWTLFTWWWPAHVHGAWSHTLFIAWAIAFGVSCFTEDTIETQAGATFFALYYTLFVFAAPKEIMRSADPAPAAQGSV